MSEQGSATHGPREDDAIKQQDRDELRAHGDEWPEPEEAGEDADGTEEVWAAEGRFAGDLPGEDFAAIELRSDLARHLDRTTFPATRAHLLETLDAHQADDRLRDLVSSLPDGTTAGSLAELLRALGIPVEERPA
jgi:hypothetical protein